MNPTTLKQAKQRRDQLGHTDFEAAFTPGTVFLRGTEEVPVEAREHGFLMLKSGQITVGQGMFVAQRDSENPFLRNVKPGRYPVACAYAENAVACLKITFSDKKIVRWEMAERVEDDPDRLASGDYLCFGVDSGEASFMDVTVVQRIVEMDSDAFRMQFKQALKREEGPIWMRIADKFDHDFVATMAGFGDGAYACYWGLDKNDKPVCFAADFAILVEGVYSECEIRPVGEFLGRPLTDPWFAAHDCRDVVLTPLRKGDFDLRYEGTDFIDVELLDAKGKKIWQSGCGRGGKKNTSFHYTWKCGKTKLDEAVLRVSWFEQFRALPTANSLR
jgi:hypothetical protein